MEKITVTLNKDDCRDSVQKMWIVRKGDQYVGFIRKFKDRNYETSPFQVFTAPKSQTHAGDVIAEFWPPRVDLTGMNRNKHRVGGYVEAARFARDYFGEKVVTVIEN